MSNSANLIAFQSEFLKKLISIRSVGSTPEEGAPYGKKSREALDFFLNEAQKAGFKTGVVGDRAGFVEFGSGDKLMGIVCHLDVVPEGEGWETDPFELTVKNGIMYGRGIIDDKGPAAASFFAMKELLDEGKIPEGYRVRLILGTDEERTCECVEYYAEHDEVPDFAITPDAQFPVIYCEKSILHVIVSGPAVQGFTADGGSAANMVPAKAKCLVDIDEILVTGKAAHASRPEQGVNAISLLADAVEGFGYDLNEYPIIKFIKDFDGFEFTGCRVADESGKLTSNIGLLKADSEGCSLVIDFRIPYSYEINDAVENLKKKASEYGLEVAIDTVMESICKDRHSPEIKKLTNIWKEHMDQFTGFKEEYRDKYTEAIAIGGGTYARHIPNTIAFGPQAPWQEDKCHQANESVAITDYIQWINIIKEVIETYE